MDTHDNIEQLEPECARVLSNITQLENQVAKVSEIIDQDGLSVLGSKGQPRPHHLLGYERRLDAALERAHALWLQLTRRLVTARERQAAEAILARANELTSWRPATLGTEPNTTSADARGRPTS